MSIKFKLFTHVYTTTLLKEIIEHYIKKIIKKLFIYMNYMHYYIRYSKVI